VILPSTLSTFHDVAPRDVCPPTEDCSHYYRYETIRQHSMMLPFKSNQGMNCLLTRKGAFAKPEVRVSRKVLGICDSTLYGFLKAIFENRHGSISVPNLSGEMDPNPEFITSPYFTTPRAVNQAAYDYGCELLSRCILTHHLTLIK
jgi:hypothetical protein